jgi:uncharacterized protein (DUF697 family)
MFTASARYHPIVKKSAVAAGALGVPGAFSFGLDVTGLSGIWITMTLAIAKESGHEIDRAFATKLIAAVTAGVAGYVGGSKVATTLLHLIPGAGSLAAVGVNSALDFLYTWRLGCSLSNLFDRSDFMPSDVRRMAMDIVHIIGPIPTFKEILSISRALRGDVDAVL